MKAVLAVVVGMMLVVGALTPLINAEMKDSPTRLDPVLKGMIAGAGAEDTFEIIITYREKMKERGMSRFDSLCLPHADLKILPMTGAIVSKATIEEILTWREVRSIYWNAPIKLYLDESADTAGARAVWDTYGETGRNATVMVIDTGADGTHPDVLYGDNLIQSVTPIDILGVGLPVTWAENAVVSDSVGHGTHCLGIVGGNGKAIGGYTGGAVEDPIQHYKYRGMAPECKLVSFGLGAVLFVFGTVQGFEYALENQEKYNISVISNSWGPSSFQEFDPEHPTNVATLECYKKGMLVVFSAGNSGPDEHTMNAYSVAPWVISVAAGTKDKKLADFSSRGTNDTEMPYDHPDITAPGVSIMAAKAKTGWLQALGPAYGDVTEPDSAVGYATFYTYMSGTSMACPHISGIAALLISANPKLSPDQVMDILTATCDPVAGMNKSWHVGAGYVNATNAYLLARNTTGNIDEFKAGKMKYDGGEDDELFGKDCLSIGYDWYPPVNETEEPKNITPPPPKRFIPGFNLVFVIAGTFAMLAVISRKRRL